MEYHRVLFWDPFYLLCTHTHSVLSFVSQVFHISSLQIIPASQLTCTLRLPAFACCLKEYIEWTSESKLKVNNDKTEPIAVGTSTRISQFIPNLTLTSISGDDIPFSQTVKKTLKKHSPWMHISNTCATFLELEKNPLLPVH